MGKGGGGGSSCFKILTCGKDPEDKDEGELSQEKNATDKRKWSFRRRSSKNQVLSNISISGPLSVESNIKCSPEASSNIRSVTTNFSQEPEQRPSVKTVEEKPPVLSAVLDSSEADSIVVSDEMKEDDGSCEESVVVVIQSAVRRFLAYKELDKLKGAVKLQAIIRGYLVRRQAVGTLRCVQAIVKLQALIRARARSNFEEKDGNDYNMKKVNYTMKKLQVNAFTCQLLASTHSKRPIYISCDPLKSASSWEWLERWMTFTSTDVRQPHVFETNMDFEDHRDNECKVAIPEASIKHQILMNDDLQDLISVPVAESQEPAEKYVSSPSLNSIEKEEILSSTSSDTTFKSDTNANNEVHSENRAVDSEKPNHTTKRVSIEHAEIESNKTDSIPKRPCNPAFAAMQSKFEELSAVPSSAKSFSSKSASSNQLIVMESKPDSLSHSVGNPDSLSIQLNKSDSFSCEAVFPELPKSNLDESSLSHQMQLQTVNSECGTEISISSTLDSPDRSEAEGGEIVLEIGALEGRHLDGNNNSNGTVILDYACPENHDSAGVIERGLSSANSHANDLRNLMDSKSENKDVIITSEYFQSPKELPEGISGNSPTLNPVSKKPSSVQHPEANIHAQDENATGGQGDLISHSPQASPRGHITASESHGTPASQASGIAKSGKTETNVPVKKSKPHVAGKRSTSNAKSSGGRDGAEHLQKDPKSGKRRISLGMVKPDFLDHEPRNSSSNPLPNYMLATESAKAKIHASNSPKSSPDVHDKESCANKRHSLPMGNGKQSASPRMQRSASQLQQGSKENNKGSPNVASERKWQR